MWSQMSAVYMCTHITCRPVANAFPNKILLIIGKTCANNLMRDERKIIRKEDIQLETSLHASSFDCSATRARFQGQDSEESPSHLCCGD